MPFVSEVVVDRTARKFVCYAVPWFTPRPRAYVASRPEPMAGRAWFPCHHASPTRSLRFTSIGMFSLEFLRAKDAFWNTCSLCNVVECDRPGHQISGKYRFFFFFLRWSHTKCLDIVICDIYFIKLRRNIC